MKPFILACAALPLLAAAANAEDPRDARIRALEQRLDQMQRRLDQLDHPASAPAPPPSAQASPTGARFGGQSEPQISDEEIGLALQSTLIQQGVSLLPSGTVQLVPSLDYTYLRSNALAITAGPTGNIVSPQDTRSDLLGGTLTARIGLPWDAQGEVVIPYDYARSRVVINGAESRRDTSGIGDLQLGLSKILWKEGDWRPTGILGVAWKSSTGTVFNPFGAGFVSTTAQRFSPGTGYDAVAASLSLTKRQDPLVFFGGLGYTHNFTGRVAGGQLDAADSVGARLGAALAASPATSLNASLNLGFTGADKFNGIAVRGTDQVNGLITFGAATVLTRHITINGTIGVGLTQGMPDFTVGLSLPIQF